MSNTKDKVLARLIKAGDYISGEQISRELGISRTAVNNAVKSLRADGYITESSTNRGYKLVKSQNKLSAGGIMAYFNTERDADIIFLESVDSTNNYLKALSSQGKAKYGDCVIANEQTGGKGRLGRSFSSVADKGIYFSYLVNPKGQSPATLSQITAWTSVAVRDAIYEFCGIKTGIKWVNDLVVGNKKLCGILTEMSVVGESGEADNVVIGIGINVNQKGEDFPEEIRKIATSLSLETGKVQNRAKLCALLTEKLDKLVKDFPTDKEYYLSEYRKSCAILGKKIRIIKNGEQRTGTAADIDDNFGLEVEFDDGKKETVTGGEVSVRGFYGYI